MKISLKLVALLLAFGLMAMVTACGGPANQGGEGAPPTENMNNNAPNGGDDDDGDGDDGDDGDDDDGDDDDDGGDD